MDQGIRGFDPEPRRGYRSAVTRDRILQAFSDAVWQRHEATHAAGGLIAEWPNRSTFQSNWPLLARDLVIADWKHAGAYALTEASEIALEVLEAQPAPRKHWRETYALELASQPELLFELSQEDSGDGIELVMERAQLSTGERWVMRDWLDGKDVMLIAADSGERPQTVGTLLRNGLYRLRWLGQATSRKRGDVRYARADAGRASDGHVPVAPAPRDGAHQEPRPGGGSGAGHLRGLPAPAARGAHRQATAPLDEERAS